MRALISNDDGIEAYGLSLLAEMVAPYCDEVVIVAPEGNRSGTSQSISLHGDLAFTQVGPHRYSCSGTPADCVLLAMNTLYKDNPPDIVFSGINHGMNVADDVGYSGTVGAAREAAIRGIRAIALSQRSGRDKEDFAETIKVADKIMPHILAQPWVERTVLNVNFPSPRLGPIKGVRAGQLDRHKLADVILPGDKNSHYRIGPLQMRPETDAGSDRAILDEAYVSLTPVLVDTTDTSQLRQLTALDL